MSDHNRLNLEMLYEQYAANMFLRAMKYVNNKEDAEDVVSEVWLSIMAHFEKLMRMEAKARSTYIMRCVQNTAIDILRKREKSMKAEKEAVGNSTFPVDDNNQTPERITDKILSRFSGRERLAVELRIKGLHDKQIANEMGISEVSVRVYLHRAYKHMREKEFEEG